MPTVATVEGVRIIFYADEHPPPHFHARFAEYTAQIRIDPVEILKGSLPPNKEGVVMDWARAHRDELLVAWLDMEAGRKPAKIE